MKNLYDCLNLYREQENVQNIAVRTGNRNEIFCDVYLYNENPVNSSTLFDMASVTKIMATTTLALVAIDKKLLKTDDSVSRFFDVPKDKESMTVKNLLTHTMGIGYKYLYKEGYNYDNIQEYILNLPSAIKIGSDVLYSCPGYILLGKIIEKVLEERLDKLFLKYVAKPIGLNNTSFLPDSNNNFVNANLNELDIGKVNDENAAFLGGVAGNAGLFSNMNDICRFVSTLLNYGAPIISKKTFLEAIKNYTPQMSASRALGFLYVDEKYNQTGNLFPNGSIGHCGHTGQSVFVDLKSGLYAIILSDATISGIKKYGRERYDVVVKMRENIHNAIYNDLKRNL